MLMRQPATNRHLSRRMKLLLDENLSPELAAWIQAPFPGSVHVREAGLKGQADSMIWEYAQKHGFAILTKDSDFQEKAVLTGAPPKVIWLRTGNCSTRLIGEWILRDADLISQFEQEEGAVLEIRQEGAKG